MGTLPSLSVKLDDGTGTFPIDISNYVLASDGYEISRGRDDWQGAVTAGELSLTLNNSDGRFTPGSTILGTPSPIKVDARIRVAEAGSATGFDIGGFDSGGFDAAGSAYRFTGYVKSWPVSWPAVVPTFSTVALTATDAQARAERRTLATMLEEEVRVDSPTAYYRLGEAKGSTSAADMSGNAMPSLTMQGSGTAPTFGTDIDGTTTGVTFSGGQILRTSGPTFVGMGAFSIEALILPTATLASGQRVVVQVGENTPSNGSSQVQLLISDTGAVWATLFGSTPTTLAAPAVTTGARHHLAATFDGNNFYLYVDGALADSRASVSTVTRLLTSVLVGGGTNGTQQLSGATVASVAVEDGAALSAARIASHAAAALGSVTTSTARLASLASYSGIPVGTLDTSLTNVPAQATSDSSGWDAIQEVADAEMGLVFVDGSGNLTFHNRARVSGKTAPDLILDAQYITPDVQPVVDDQRIVNYFEATASGTGATVLARNIASELTTGGTGHGRYPVSQTYLVQTDQEALDRANWIVSKQAEPGTRYGTLTINLYKMTTTLATSVVQALDLDCWLRITSMASQNPGGSVTDVVVQGWRETATGDSWSISCNVVAKSLYTSLILDDPTFGALDSYALLP